MYKIYFAIGNAGLENFIKTSTKVMEHYLHTEIKFVGETVYREGIITGIRDFQPDLVIISEGLPGKTDIKDIICTVRMKFPDVRIIFLAGDREVGDSLLAIIAQYGVYDLIIGTTINAKEVIKKIIVPNTLADIAHLIPKITVDEKTKNKVFEAPDIQPIINTKGDSLFEDNKNDDIGIAPIKNTREILDKISEQEQIEKNEQSKREIEERKKAEQIQKEKEEQEKQERDRVEQLQRDKEEQERREREERGEREEQERKEREEQERIEREAQLYQEKVQKENEERLQREKKERLQREQEQREIERIREIERKEQEEREEREKIEQEKREREEREREEQEKIEREEKERYEQAQREIAEKKESRIEPIKVIKPIKPITEERQQSLNNYDIPKRSDRDVTRNIKVKQPEKEKSTGLFGGLFGGNKSNKNVRVSQQIITFMGGHSGVGNSQLAFNVALSLSTKGYKVIYMDLNDRFSAIDCIFQLGYSDVGIDTAIQGIIKEDYTLVDRSLVNMAKIVPNIGADNYLYDTYTKIPTNIDFLLFSQQYMTRGEDNYNKVEEIDKSMIKDLIMYLMMKKGYDFIIIDAPCDIYDKITATSLIYTSKIFFTVTQDIAVLTNHINNIKILNKKRINFKEKFYYLLNKYENVGFKIKDVYELLSESIRLDNFDMISIPNVSKDLIVANYLGEPILWNTKSKEFIKSISDIEKLIFK